MTFRQNIARFVTGDLNLKLMPAMALDALEQGLDSPSLRSLASLGEDEEDHIIVRNLHDALQELSIELPSFTKAALEVGVVIADEILEGKREVFQGVEYLVGKITDQYGFFWDDDNVGFRVVYYLLEDMEAMRNSGRISLQHDPTNELSVKLNNDLLAALKEWVTRMRAMTAKQINDIEF